MRIAIYAGAFKMNQDGATKTLYELVESLLENGIEVGVWGFNITPRQRDGLHLYPIPSIPLPFYPDYKVTLPNPKMKNQLREFAPDVLHITVPDIVGISLVRFAGREGIPVLASYHTDFPSYLKSYHLGKFYKPAWRYFKWFYNKSQTVLAPTQEIIAKLKRNGIEHVKLWSRGIHLHKYSRNFRSDALRTRWGADTPDKKVILYSGRFVWFKDLQTFIEVYELFKESGPRGVVFVLAGDGPIRHELEQRMPDAYFTGYLEGEELSRVYASADLLLFPSTTETFGNVVLEALSSGIPVVVSNIGGCKEIIRQSGGGLISIARDPQSFYENCRRLICDIRMYEIMQSQGLRYAEERNWEKINRCVIEEYQHICQNKGTGRRTETRTTLLVNNYR
jgi:phosphatidylinositol alpha 1,6-mannosyltransferase